MYVFQIQDLLILQVHCVYDYLIIGCLQIYNTIQLSPYPTCAYYIN